LEKNRDENISRRNFIKTLGFSFFFTSLLAGTAALAVKGKGNLSGQSCGNQYICRKCGLIENCGLPQALSFKTVSGVRVNNP
jgi:hypothetical protein